MKWLTNTVIFGLLGVLLAVAFLYSYGQDKDCEKKNGIYAKVYGDFVWTCITKESFK